MRTENDLHRHELYRVLRDRAPVPYFTIDDALELWFEHSGDAVTRKNMVTAIDRLVKDELLRRKVRGVFEVRRGDERRAQQEQELSMPQVRGPYVRSISDPGRKTPLEVRRERSDG